MIPSKNAAGNISPVRAAAWALAAVLALSALSCKGGSGEEKAAKAQQEIIESLILYPDAAQRSVKADAEKDSLIISYGTNESLDALQKFYSEAVRKKLFKIVLESETGISYRDDAGRLVTIMWYARDPDISEYRSVFHVAVQPLPPELKPKS